jgi:nucleoside phosphorylase
MTRHNPIEGQSSMDARIRSHDDYTVGWICALPVETAAAKLMLDEVHPPLPHLPMDQNAYIFGNIGEHNIVIASLPVGAYGNTSAATVGMQLLSSFHAIRFGFMVGIGGGVPSSNTDIRLGDIVVSQPTDTAGGVIQYDLGKTLSGGQFKRIGMLNRPPKILLTALATLQANHLVEDSRIVEFVSNLQANMAPHKAAKFTRPTQEDYLFQAEYNHIASNTCLDCDRSKLIPRTPREHQEPIIHYGLIGSANQVVKDGMQRDKLARDLGIYCVEMEAAGLMNDFPCLVIRGICDYADSHKTKEWQGYAAAVAAAYTRELLLVVPIDYINSTPVARGALADSGKKMPIVSLNKTNHLLNNLYSSPLRRSVRPDECASDRKFRGTARRVRPTLAVSRAYGFPVTKGCNYSWAWWDGKDTISNTVRTRPQR